MNCKKCNIELAGGNHYKSDAERSIYICKECRKDRTKVHYKNNTESYINRMQERYSKAKGDCKVYLLENENYVGVTQNMEWRMSQHKHLNRNTDKVRVLYQTKNRADALELEELLHDIGYEGRHSQNTYK